MKSIGKIIHNKNFPLLIRDSKEHVKYYELTRKLWAKRLYDNKGTLIYFENSVGILRDNR